MTSWLNLCSCRKYKIEIMLTLWMDLLTAITAWSIVCREFWINLICWMQTSLSPELPAQQNKTLERKTVKRERAEERTRVEKLKIDKVTHPLVRNHRKLLQIWLKR